MFGLQIKQGQAGQALIEAALALPVLLMLSFLMIDVGTGFFVRNTMNNVARDEARILATDPKLNPNYRPPVGSTQTPQQAVAQAISDAKTRITIRIAPIAGMGKPLSVSNDGIQILVPGVNGTPGNLTDNPVEVRITRQLNLISANFIPDAAADRIINTSVSASAFVEKGTISGDINLVTEDGRSITTETDLCTEGQICTCETDRTLCKPEELCTVRREKDKCTAQQKCDIYGECTCATKASLCTCKDTPDKCTPEELCTIRNDPRACCQLYGGLDGTGKMPNGVTPACDDYYYCERFGNNSNHCCRVHHNFCSTWCQWGNAHLEASPGNQTIKYYRDLYCCIYDGDDKTGKDDPDCCELDPNICRTESQRCELNDMQACCLLKAGEAGAEKCTCKYDKTRCTSGNICIEHPDSNECCLADNTKCAPGKLCQLTGQSCTTDHDRCYYAKDSDACCRYREDWCSDANVCANYKDSTRCRCLPGGAGTTSECCAYRRDTSLACCQANMNQCKPVDVCSVYPDQPKCKVEG